MRSLLCSLTAGALALALLAVAEPANALPNGPVSQMPASWTPQLATSESDGTVEKLRQLVPCGSMMYAVGTFTAIEKGSTVYARNNAFSFNATTGAVSAWNPNVSGTVVDSVALSPDCSAGSGAVAAPAGKPAYGHAGTRFLPY